MKVKPQEKTISDKSKNPLRNYFIVIFVGVFLLYGNSIKNGYALDDNYVTVIGAKANGNQRVAKGIKGIPEIFTTHYVETKEQSFEYRPIPLATFAIEYQIFGSSSKISHFISVFIYAITCMLLFFILSRLLINYNVTFPFLITVLFLIHPIHSEVVDNIKCRDELLGFLFGLCALHFFISINDKNKWKNIFLTGLFLLISLLCKKTAILFLALIPIVGYFFREAKLKGIIVQIVLVYLVFVIFTLLENALLAKQVEKRVFAFFENPLFYNNNLMDRISLAFYTLGYYFKLLVFPFPLTSYYGYDVIPITGFSSLLVIFSAAFYFSTGIYALLKLKEKKLFSFGMLVFLIGLFPFANLIDPVPGMVAERFVYFASLGFCIVVIYVLLSVFKIDYRSKSHGLKILTPSSKGILISVALLFSIIIISRNNKWKDELTLLRSDTTHFEESCNLHYLLGNALYPEILTMAKGIKREEMIKEATFHYKSAVSLMKEGIKLYPKDFTTLTNIGTIYVNIFNDAFSAQPYFKRSLAINPANIVTQYNFVFCYERKNLPDSAIIGYEKLISNNTNYPLVYFRLHELYLQKKEYKKAIVCDEKAIKQNPENARLYINLGNALILNNDSAGAVKPFKRAIELEPNNTDLRAQVEEYLKLTEHLIPPRN
jgi:protein O-mannosyl-transferase